MTKICPKCAQRSLQKYGTSRNRQKHKCRDCGYVFRGSKRSVNNTSDELFHKYSVRKQTLSELAHDTNLSIRTIHRKIVSVFREKQVLGVRLNPHLSEYASSVLILDATFFGKRGSNTQWGILVAQDGLTGDILASKHIFQETLNDYRSVLALMKRAGYSKPYFAVIDGRNGVEGAIKTYYDIPVQICQSHKIATIDRYLLKHPRIESYQVLKRIAHDMVRTDKVTFIWMLEEFREKYVKDFKVRELDTKTLKYRYIHPRLRLAFQSLMRDVDRLFVSLDSISVIHQNINTTNRIECEFSHLKPKIKLHRGLSKERRLSLALSLLWKD